MQLFGSCLLILYFGTFIGCTLKTVGTMETGKRDSLRGKVLIAAQKSEFKRIVVSEIKDNLGDNVFYVKVVDIMRSHNNP